MSRTVRIHFLVPLALIAFAPLACFAQTATFNLPAQPLAESLKAIGTQTGLNIMVSPPLVDGKQAPALKANLTAKDALARLLVGTRLEYHFVNDQTVVIRAAQAVAANDPPPAQSSNPPTQDTKEAGKNSSQDFRVAQLDQTSAAPSTVEKGDEKESKKSSVLQEVVVTGSRIPTVAGNEVQPVRSYTRQDIENSGQATLADFLNNLPDVSIGVSESGQGQNFFSNYPGQTAVSLHGLPVGTTIVLLNGQRVESSYLGFFDVSNIPVSAVERVEVLPVGASAIYGADALGGAVNIILRRNINGLEISGSLGHADEDTDKTVNLAWGKTWTQDSVSIIATYQNRGLLLGGARDLTSTTDIPASVAPFALLPNCSPGNVYSVNGQNLPGLSAPEAGIPAGITGTPTIQQFVGTAGKPNQCTIYDSTAFIPSSEREGIVLSARHHFSDSTDVFLEVLGSHEVVQAPFGRAIDTATGGNPGFVMTLGAKNPYNPFGEDVDVSFSYPIPIGYRTTGDLIRPLVGVEGSTFGDWKYEATAFFSRDIFTPDSTTNVTGFGNANPNPLQVALESSNPATALNPFLSTNIPNSSLLQSLTAPISDTSHYVAKLTLGQALLQGPLLTLPAGPLNAAFGVEGGHEVESFSGTQAGTIESDSISRTSYAIFSEFRAPLLAGPGKADRLALALAGRYDHTSDFGGKATYQAGINWHPTDGFSVSGGHGVSYQAPKLAQILGSSTPIPYQDLGVTDPYRGDQEAFGSLLIGSNPNLKPETGSSNSLSIKYADPSGQGLRTSLNYFSIDISNYIGQPSTQILVDNPMVYPGSVVRGPPSASDIAKGWLGPITQVNELFYNFGDIHVAGFDFDASYTFNSTLGRFTPAIALANIYKWKSALAPNTPQVDYVNQAGGVPGWSPRWKGTASLAWGAGPATINLAGRYTGSYHDYQTVVPNTNILGNVWIFDANARFDVGQLAAGGNAMWAGTYVEIGAVNLFDKLPPFSYALFPPYDLTQYDIRGRYLYLRAGAKW